MSELFIVVGLKAKTGKEAELKQDLMAVVEPSRREDGSVAYELFEDLDNPGLFVFYEHWASVEAREQHHHHGLHIQQFQANGMQNVESVPFSHMLKRLVKA